MTTELESQRQTAEWFEALTPSVKDMVCDHYLYILRHHDFTDEGITVGCMRSSITSLSPKFIQRFIDNIDHIKNLYDNRPSKTVNHWTLIKENLEYGIYANCRFKRVTVFGYDEQKIKNRINHELTDWASTYKDKFENTIEIKK